MITRRADNQTIKRRLRITHITRKMPEGIAGKTYPGKSINTEISPLRCAPVEMTKGWGSVSIKGNRRVVGIRGLCCFGSALTLNGSATLPLCHLDRSAAKWRDLCVDALSWKRPKLAVVAA
jgi:hypothetical protein